MTEEKGLLAEEKNRPVDTDEKKEWEKPILEDVSEKIMAQPYIRFT